MAHDSLVQSALGAARMMGSGLTNSPICQMGAAKVIGSALRGASESTVQGLVGPWIEADTPGAVRIRGGLFLAEPKNVARWALSSLAETKKWGHDQLVSQLVVPRHTTTPVAITVTTTMPTANPVVTASRPTNGNGDGGSRHAGRNRNRRGHKPRPAPATAVASVSADTDVMPVPEEMVRTSVIVISAPADTVSEETAAAVLDPIAAFEAAVEKSLARAEAREHNPSLTYALGFAWEAVHNAAPGNYAEKCCAANAAQRAYWQRKEEGKAIAALPA